MRFHKLLITEEMVKYTIEQNTTEPGQFGYG